MSVLVVIVNYRSAELTLQCLRSLISERDRVPDLRVVIIENASGDEAALRQGLADPVYDQWTELIVSERNGGFAYGNNCAIRQMLSGSLPADYVLLLNPDTIVHSGAVETLLTFMETHPDVGIAGAGLDQADGSDWPYAFRFPTVFSELDAGLGFGPVSRLLKKHAVAQRMGPVAQPIDWVPGAAMIVRREVFDDVGLMDEHYFLYYEETDFCQAAKRAGWSCWYVPEARVLHIAGQSTGVTAPGRQPAALPEYWFESRRRYFMKNHGFRYALVADLAYLTGLALDGVRIKIQMREDPRPRHLFRDVLRNSALWRKNRKVEPPVTD
ncbi:MAG: glycosyltransferase family 2 protein [Myxococcales bacterium]|nr:glycosyltransferase family 2 protein [Myxococcales bacterium]MDH3484852.1 glycosyltransferase family 2 protein [Myxococcales bacterium]